MPESYRFTDSAERIYPETRDGHDVPLGTVQPGDVRDFEGPPDFRWVLAADGDGAQKLPRRRMTATGTADQDAGSQAGSDEAGQSGTLEG